MGVPTRKDNSTKLHAVGALMSNIKTQIVVLRGEGKQGKQNYVINIFIAAPFSLNQMVNQYYNTVK